jgi:ubiquinone/menaquinone biosynthesis C-methylase UbiE
MELYDQIGRDYNTTRKADSFIAERLIHHFGANFYPTGKLLDLGCGTGNYATKLSTFPLEITGLDPSERMLDEARIKTKMINWLVGTAEELPFEDAGFDAVLCMLTIHHWKDLQKGMVNVFRVLKNQGKLLLFTPTQEQMEQYWLNHYFPGMMAKSISEMPSYKTISDVCLDAGFRLIETEKYFVHEGLEDLFLYSGKNNPFLYFNTQIRNGISSFANSRNSEQTLHGLKNLYSDLQTGHFETVRGKYQDDLGDYMFFLLSKQSY